MEGPAAAAGGGGNGNGGAQGRGGGGGPCSRSRCGRSGGGGTGGGGGAAAAQGARSPAGGNAAGSGQAAGNGRGVTGNGVAAEGFVVTFYTTVPVPAAARPWFPCGSDVMSRVPVTVYGRLPNSSLKPHSVTLHVHQQRGWRLTGIVPLANDLAIHKGDRVRLAREPVGASGGGTAEGGMGVVVEKVAAQQEQQQQQQGQHRRRHVRTAIHIGTPKPVTVMPSWHVCSILACSLTFVLMLLMHGR